MIQGLYGIFDSKAGSFLDPFVAASDAVACRTAVRAALDPQHVFNGHGADFTLFRLGAFDQVDGKITVDEARTNLGTLLQIRVQHEADTQAQEL